MSNYTVEDAIKTILDIEEDLKGLTIIMDVFRNIISRSRVFSDMIYFRCYDTLNEDLDGDSTELKVFECQFPENINLTFYVIPNLKFCNMVSFKLTPRSKFIISTMVSDKSYCSTLSKVSQLFVNNFKTIDDVEMFLRTVD